MTSISEDTEDLYGDLLNIAQRLEDGQPPPINWLRDVAWSVNRQIKLKVAIREENEILRQAIKAALLFHSGSPWTPEKHVEWMQLTNSDAATTKALCDTLREALGDPW